MMSQDCRWKCIDLRDERTPPPKWFPGNGGRFDSGTYRSVNHGFTLEPDPGEAIWLIAPPVIVLHLVLVFFFFLAVFFLMVFFAAFFLPAFFFACPFGYPSVPSFAQDFGSGISSAALAWSIL